MRSSPVQVGSSFYRVLASSSNLSMIDPYGTISTMGDNTYGQVGAPAAYSWSQLSNGDAHSLALRSDGVLYAWGLNTSGQLGTGDTAYRSSPVQISTQSASLWSQVSAGSSHSLAISNDGLAYGWGLNTSGQVGDITVVSRSTPVQVGLAGPPTFYSMQFNGSNYLTLGGQSNFAFPAATDFTIEMWIYPTAFPTTAAQIYDTRPAGTGSTAAGYHILSMYPDGAIGFGGTAFTSGGPVKLNQWTHIATTRQGTNLKLFLNGMQVGTTATDSTSYIVGASRPIIGTDGNVPLSAGYSYTGYISNLRVIKGTALYTTNFTVTTAPLTTSSQGATPSQVSLLTGQGNPITDASTNAFTITNTGTVTPAPLAPFTYYSLYFNGVSSVEVAAAGSLFNFGTSPFTIEAWTYATAPVSEFTNAFYYGNYANGVGSIAFGINGYTGKIAFSRSSGTTANNYIYGPTWNINTWNHVALVGDGTNITLYVDGVSYGTQAQGNLNALGGFRIGAGDSQTTDYGQQFPFKGYISNVRVVKGTAVYTGNFTVPTNILSTTQYARTNIVALTGTETILLTAQSSTIVDNSASPVTIVNNYAVPVSSTVAPFTGVTIVANTGTVPAIAVSAGKDYSVIIKADNTLWSWGINNTSQLGSITAPAGANITVSRSSPVQIGTSSWSLISAGASHALAIDINGKLYGWGRTIEGQLAVNPPIASWVQIAAGTNHMMAIRGDGKLYAWSNTNSIGEMGLGDTISRSSPVQVGTSSWSKVAAGDSFTIAIRADGTLWSWGLNQAGRLGLNDTFNRSSPVQVTAIAGSWSQITAGSNYAFAIRTDGLLYGWGNNAAGQTGDGSVVSKSIPTLVTGGITSWTAVAAGTAASGGITLTGSLYLWGTATVNGTSVNRSAPLQLGTNSWAMINAAASVMTGIDSLGKLYSWGINTAGDFGDGSAANATVTRSSPVQIGVNDSWIYVKSGTNATMAITKTYTLWGWGANSNKQLGDGSTITNRSSMVQIGTNVSFTQVQVGGNTGMGVTSDYRLFTWGVYGGGDGTTNARLSPTQMSAMTDNIILSPVQIGTSSWSQISAGATHSMGISSDGKMFTWGNNATGQLGYAATFTNLGPGYSMSTVIRSDGTLWAWGAGSNGQLAQVVETINRSAPVQIGPTDYLSWKFVGRNSYTSAAIRGDGKLFTWGSNVGGQLGVGDVVYRSSPVQVGTSSWSMVAVTGFSSNANIALFAIRADGTLWGWGNNANYQLSTGDTTNRSSPVQIGTNSWITVSTNDSYVLGIQKDGTLWGWGLNTNYQLGLGDTVLRSVPTQISTSSWTQVSAGYQYGIGLRNNNIAYGWGVNVSGQIGDGTTVSRSTPVQIGTAVTSLSNANAYSVAFNGTTSYLSLSSSALNAASSDFSLEFWVFPTNLTLPDQTIFCGGVNGFNVVLSNGTGRLDVTYANSNSVNGWSSTVYLTQGVWSHVVLAKIGNGWMVYVNGIYRNKNSHVQSVDCSSTTIGYGSLTYTNYFAGNISNMRFIISSVPTEYTTTYSNVVGGTQYFNVPTTPYSSISGTQLLTCQNTTLVDNSSNNISITNNGSATVGSLITPYSQYASAGGFYPVFIDTGSSHTVALDASNRLYGWGQNTSGELAQNDIFARSAPVQIPGTWSKVAAAPQKTFAINNNGLYVWGLNTTGELGDGTTVTKSSPAVLTSLSLPNVSSPTQLGTGYSWGIVSAGLNYSSAIRSDGSLFNWGFNTQGQVFTGTTITRSSPTQIGTQSYTLVSAGGTHLTYVKSSASTGSQPLLLGSGFNTSGQVGDLSILSRSSPVQVAASLSFYRSPIIVTTGNYTAYYNSSPVQVGTSSWSSVSSGGTHTIGLTSSKTLFAWGQNINGQLGIADTINRSSPVQVGASLYASISAGDTHNIVAKSDGTILGFGNNNFGQLGDGT